MNVDSPAMQAMRRMDALLSHVWMVRTFLKHSEEVEEDDRLSDVVRDLYDMCLAVGPALERQDADEYLHLARKKLSKLKATTEYFAEIMPEISAHTNFKMALASLQTAVGDIEQVIGSN